MSLIKYRFVNEPVKVQNVLFVVRGFKTIRDKQLKHTPTYRALSHFDDFYKAVFTEKWPSVRLALLSKPKYVAVINNFGEIEKTQEIFLSKGAFNLRSYLEHQKNYTLDSDVENSKPIQKMAMEEIVQQQFQAEEERESQLLHPEGMEFKSKVEDMKQNNSNTEDEYVYKPEDARTSLESDINRAEIDTKRLILPNDKISEGNLKEFIPATTLRGAEGFIVESEYYKYYRVKVKDILKEDEHELEFPEELKVYSFDRGDLSEFPDPARNCIHLYDYLKVDGAELLAALALGVKPGDTVLDLCSSSGNISYCLFQSLRAKFLICTKDRYGNIRNLFQDYLLNFINSWQEMLYVTPKSPEHFEEDYSFDKVLVNVPSTEDKTALFDDEDNMFHVIKSKDRLQLPEYQSSLLKEGLSLVRPGGTVVYTSATLSPIQNDGVVNETLQGLREERGEEFVVKNDPKKGFFCQVTSGEHTKCLRRNKGMQCLPMEEKPYKLLQRYYFSHNTALVKLLNRLGIRNIPQWWKDDLSDTPM